MPHTYWDFVVSKHDVASFKRHSRMLCITFLVLLAAFGAGYAGAQQVESTLPISQRQTINLAAGMPQYIGNASATSNATQSNWWFENTNNSTLYSSTGFNESADTSASWAQVGLPYDANIPRTFINQTSGGGQGSLTGNNNWYRLHFKVDPTYAGQKFLLKLEGSHTGVQVFINGTLLPGVSAVVADAQATHVVGFIPVIVDLTPYITADGKTDNVIAIDVSRGSSWFEQPNFSGAFRFGQAMAGLFRNVKLYVTNPVHIPPNVYSNQKTWGTYVGTVSEVPAAQGTATAASAVVDVQTNVLNESATAQLVTLTTQIVDAKGNVVASAPPVTQSVPAMTPGNYPSGATPMFDQKITVNNPTLWYPNNANCGTPAVACGSPYLYKVYHIVSVNGVVVDSTQDTLGIRTITWDANFPYFNGHAVYMWGGSGRYDYPALGSSVPDEQVWRDMAQIAAQGGNVWRPGHSTSGEALVAAADAYGIMIDQPSGDGEGYWNASSNPTADDLQLKQELHRDMIIRDRSHPSILDWERDNGGMNTTLADELGGIETTWDNINPRGSADRTFSPSYGLIDECDGAGCGVLGQHGHRPWSGL
jgi:beta-galactosidase